MHFLTDTTVGTLTRAHLASLSYMLLPFVEQDILYRQFNLTDPPSYNRDSQTSPGGTSRILAVYNCPSDFSNPGNRTFLASGSICPPPPFSASFTGRYSLSNYVANGLVFRSNAAQFPASLTDGTWQTILFGERYQLCGGGVMWGWGGNGNVNPSFAFLPLPGGAFTGKFAPDVPLRLNGAGQVYGKVGLDPGDAGTVTRPVPFQSRPSLADCDPSLAQSPHSGMLQVGLGDSSVRGVSGGVSQLTFWSACTRRGARSWATTGKQPRRATAPGQRVRRPVRRHFASEGTNS